MNLDYNNLGKCLEEILEIDRQDSESFHEDFVRCLAKFGFEHCLTTEEEQWYKDNKDNYCQNISEYVLFV